MSKDSSNIEVLASRVRAYILENPLAADSIIGISQWWISGVDSSALLSINELQEALELMEKKGDIISFRNADGTQIWRRPTENLTN